MDFLDSRFWTTLGPIIGVVVGGFITYAVESSRSRTAMREKARDNIRTSIVEVFVCLMKVHNLHYDPESVGSYRDLYDGMARGLATLRVMVPLDKQGVLDDYVRVAFDYIDATAQDSMTDHLRAEYQTKENRLLELVHGLLGA